MLKRCFLVGSLLVAAVSPLDAQQRDPGGFGNRFATGRGNLLVDVPEVRRELGVERIQADLLEDLASDLREQRRAIVFGRDGLPGAEGGSFEEQLRARFEKIGADLRAFDQRSEELVAVVLEPKQAQRLRQLRLQREGLRALQRERVATELSLSEEQREEIGQIREKHQRAQTASGRLNRKERRELREQEDAELLGMLTEEQKKTWEEIQGAPFDFPPPRRSGDGFRGPGN
jgi:hypothetical protein